MPSYVLTEREYFAVQRAALSAEPVRQLAARWPCLVVSRETSETHVDGPGIVQVHLVCVACDQSVYRLLGTGQPGDDSPPLTWGPVLDHIAAHIRQCHEDALPA